MKPRPALVKPCGTPALNPKSNGTNPIGRALTAHLGGFGTHLAKIIVSVTRGNAFDTFTGKTKGAFLELDALSVLVKID
jgi:hypothetical protein